MEELDIDFETFFATEFAQENSPNNSDIISNNVLSVKKRIILTDELLGKFSETLTENENLRAEKNKNLEQLQHYRQTLFSHLSTNTDWQKKYDQLEERLFTTQKQLDMHINLVAARDSIVRQYESLTKEKEGEIKKLKDENQNLKKNQNDKSEEKRLKRKYNVTLKRCNELSEIIEKLQTCPACQELKSIKNKKKKVKNENYLDDLGSFSPDNGIPASVCSMDTGFESSLSDSDSDLENVSHKMIPKSGGMVNDFAETSLKNEEQCGAQKNVNEKLCDISASHLLNNKSTKCGENSLQSESLPSTSCTNCLRSQKDVAEKYVQTRIVKYVDSYTEVDHDAVCKSTQTMEAEATSDKPCEVLSKAVQTIPVTIQSESPAIISIQFPGRNSNNNIPLCNMQVLKSDVGCQAQEEGKLLLQADVGCQTEVEESFKEQVTDSDGQGDLFLCDINYTQPWTSLPLLLSPLPPSPLVEDLVSEMDDEIMSDSSSLLPNEENEFSDDLDHSPARSFTNSTTQTDDLYCLCKQQRKCTHLDAAVQCGDLEAGSNSVVQKNKITVNKYAMKCREQTFNKTMEENSAERETKVDGETFWKKLFLWLISDEKSSIAEKQCVIDLLRDRSDFLTTEPSTSTGSEIHSLLGQIRFQIMSEDFQQSSPNKWGKTFPMDSIPVKPIVVEMNRSRGVKGSVQNSVFPFYHQHSSGCDPEEDSNMVVERKLRKGKSYPQKSKRTKLTDRKRVLESTSTFSLLKKKNKRVNSYLLKRKQSSRKQLQVFNSTSGAFTVSSLPKCDNERELNEHLLSTPPHNNWLGNNNVESGGHGSCDEYHIVTNREPTSQSSSETFEIIDNDMSNIIPSDNSTISNVTNSNCVKTASLETVTALTKQRLSSYLSNSLEKEIQSVSIANNIFSAVTKPGLCNDSHNERHSKENVDPRFENIIDNYNVLEVPEHANKIPPSASKISSRSSDEFATILNNQPIALHQSGGQPSKRSCSDHLSTPESSRSSSKASFHSCETFVMSQVENVNENLKEASNFPVEEKVTNCSDADDNCSPAKIRRLPSSDSHFSNLSGSVVKSPVWTANNVSDTTPKNIISQGKLATSQHDIHPTDIHPLEQRNENHPVIYKSHVCLSQNNNLVEVNKNLHQLVGKNYSSNNSSHGMNINLISTDYIQQEIGEVENKNDSYHIFEEDSRLNDKTKERESQLSMLRKNQTEDIPCVPVGDTTAVDSHDDQDEDDNDNEDNDSETDDHGYESYLFNNNTCNKIDDQITQNVATSLQLSSEKSTSENNVIEVATNSLQSNKITSSCNLQGSFSQTPVSYSTRTIVSNNKFEENDVKSVHKPSENIVRETNSDTKEIIKMSSNERLPYRKYCESTIKEFVAVRPPLVDNEIAQKNMIRDTVRAKRLLIPANAKKIDLERKAVVPSHTTYEEKAIQKESFGGLDQSSPFCRQGMTGRRKIVLTSTAPSNCEATTSIENSESNSYSELTKKHRVAHVPNKDATCNKRIIGESSSDEMPLFQKNAKRQANLSHISCQRPPMKKTKLQKLKQQCITRRRRIQDLTSDNLLKPTPNKPETVCSEQKTSKQNKSKESVNVCVSDHLPTLQDIALDMMLSDSDESISENSQKEKQCKNLCGENFNKAGTSGKEEMDFGEINKTFHMKLKQLPCHSQRDSRILSLGTNDFTVCAEAPFRSVINKQEDGNKDVCSNSKYCQINDTLEAVSTKNKDSERKDTEIEQQNIATEVDVDYTVLESPLSPPDLNFESNNHLPVTIPTSPVYTGSSENLDEVNFINSNAIVHDNGLSQEEIGSDGEADGTLLENSSSSENDENNVKLRSWNKQLNSRLKKCQEPNVLQKYFEHHYKNQEMNKKKVNKKQKLELKNYSVTKKNVESSFNTYLDSEFTEAALVEVVEDCKKVIKGDYRIIVKNVVKYCKYSSTEKCDFSLNFPMNPTQLRLFTLIIKLENDHPTIVDEVLERITFVVCNINHHRYRPTLNCLAQFFTAFCKMRNDKRRAQIFCYDALYCLKMRAHTVLYAVLTTFPECFPNANSPTGNSLIVQAMVYCIFKYGDSAFSDTKNLRNFLSDCFCYKIDKLLSFEDLEYFMKEIKRGVIPEVEQAILLLAKFKADWSWTYGKLMKDCLLRTVEHWREGHASENSAALCIKLCAYLAKTPPYDKIDVSCLMTLFENILVLEAAPSVVKEACIFSLATLVQMNDRKVFAILKKCKSEKYLENSKYLQDVLNVVLRRRNMKWWSRFFQK